MFISRARLATYNYYNMDQVVAQSLTLFKRLVAENTNDQHVTDERLASRPS